jgi:hypothetical protein
MGIKTADGKHNFKTCLYFLIFKLSSPIGILLTLSALHAIHRARVFDYLLQQPKRQSASLLQAAGRYSTTASNTLLFSRIFWNLLAVSNPFLQAAKRNLIRFRAETKGGK